MSFQNDISLFDLLFQNSQFRLDRFFGSLDPSLSQVCLFQKKKRERNKENKKKEIKKTKRRNKNTNIN